LHHLTLTDAEIAEITLVVDRIAADHGNIEDPKLVDNARLYAHELPQRVKIFLEEYRMAEPSAICLVSGFPVDDEAIGRTPDHWNQVGADSPTLRQEIFFMLCAVAIGDLFGWVSAQNARIMHDVLPIKAHREEQLGVGSEMTLFWHTEDAFSPFKGDYVALMCLRNHDEIETTLCEGDSIDWSRVDVDKLFQPEYPIRPDDSHLPRNNGLTERTEEDPVVAGLLERSRERVEDLYDNPRKKPVLYGDPSRPYMSLDPYYMLLDAMEPEARKAFDGFTAAVDKQLTGVVLRPGDVCFIDNLRAVHGRAPFVARYDGTDRWLKRLNITRNLRVSREARRSSTDRIIY
jgi:L-asparagine oxygenase